MKDAINFYSDATASAQCEGTFKPCSNVMSTFAFFAKRIRAKQNTSTKNGSRPIFCVCINVYIDTMLNAYSDVNAGV